MRAILLTSVSVILLTQATIAQEVLQPQSQEDFSRLLSPGFAAREMTPDKLRQLQAEAKNDCFSPESFQRSVPALKPGQPRPLPCSPQNEFDRFVMWNQIALDTTAIDHAPPPPGVKQDMALHHLGPHRSSRAMAIVHIAIFDAINVASRFNPADPNKPDYKFETFTWDLPKAKRKLSMDIVITYAAAEVLKSLYKEQATAIADFVKQDEGTIVKGKNPEDPIFKEARDLGRAAARKILEDRKNDNSAHMEPEVGNPGFPLEDGAGRWRPDPVSNVITALGGRWGKVRPFSIKNVPTFRPPPPPMPTDDLYARDFEEVKNIGGIDSSRSTSQRTEVQTRQLEEQKLIGVFWAYDGTAFLCAPPRLYNQVVRQIVQQLTKEARQNGEEPNLLNYARLFALSNIAMADAAISAWDSKYHFSYWRPVVGIRSAATDGNSSTQPDFFWKAYGAPASNSIRGPNFTPPFPSYPSGHAVFGGALFEILRNFVVEETSFEFMSDEYNGLNRPAGSDQPRPKVVRKFANLRGAEDENARSRVYLGVHWQFDADAGVAQGNQIGNFVAASKLRCLTKDGNPIDCKPGSGLEIEKRFLISTDKRVLSTPRPATQ